MVKNHESSDDAYCHYGNDDDSPGRGSSHLQETVEKDLLIY